MNNWSLEYILSQILIIISYILICKTYFLNKRNKILIINVFAHAFQGLSFLLLNGLTGAAMSFVYVIRDSFFVLDEKNREKERADDLAEMLENTDLSSDEKSKMM